jgi:adenine-specific DNA-methyltransferase
METPDRGRITRPALPSLALRCTSRSAVRSLPPPSPFVHSFLHSLTVCSPDRLESLSYAVCRLPSAVRHPHSEQPARRQSHLLPALQPTKARTTRPPASRRERQTRQYAYDPHLDPQLVWAGKAEHTSFEVEVVSLHIHERISTRAILDAVRRPDPVQFDLFGETPLPADKQIEFYQHEVGWANRLILGDSLLVMNSLLVKEGMAGKVQMIYIDPPYGIKYASNFQPRIDRRDVKDKDEDLTHEPEQIKAYRDTWTLGIHSYLTYLRDRLLLARELLTESGSIFVQINDENLHLVRCLLDEVFGRENFVAVVAFRKTGSQTSQWLPTINDYLLWYARSKSAVKYRPLFVSKDISVTKEFQQVQLPDGTMKHLTSEEQLNPDLLPQAARVFKSTDLQSRTGTESTRPVFEFRGRKFSPRAGAGWRTTLEGLKRLAAAERILAEGSVVRYVHYLDDAPGSYMTNVWMDMMGEPDRVYAVQTNTKVVSAAS